MKVFTLLSTVFITILGCNCQKATTSNVVENSNSETQKNMEIAQNLPLLEYELTTRGFYEKVIIEGSKITIITSRDGETSLKGTIAPSDVELLEKAYKKVTIENLPNLIAPTEKRFYDGAPIAVLEIIKQKETIRSASFDGGFPPAEIKELVDTIVLIAEKVKK